MTDQPLPLPIVDREIEDVIDRAFDTQANCTVPLVRGEMFSFDTAKTDIDTLSRDPLRRIEQKLDAMMTTITALKTRVDSLDATLARIIHRR